MNKEFAVQHLYCNVLQGFAINDAKESMNRIFEQVREPTCINDSDFT